MIFRVHLPRSMKEFQRKPVPAACSCPDCPDRYGFTCQVELTISWLTARRSAGDATTDLTCLYSATTGGDRIRSQPFRACHLVQEENRGGRRHTATRIKGLNSGKPELTLAKRPWTAVASGFCSRSVKGISSTPKPTESASGNTSGIPTRSECLKHANGPRVYLLYSGWVCRETQHEVNVR